MREEQNNIVFQVQFKPHLGEHYDRAFKVFAGYGVHLAFDVAKVIAHAHKKNMLLPVLEVLEEHYEKYLIWQDVSVRGRLLNEGGINPTTLLIDSIYRKMLDLPLEDQSW